MWRGCVDVIATSNMTNMEIDIIIFEEGKVPEIRIFKPDHKFPWKDDDPMKPMNWPKVSQGKMTVLNYKNTHFNLIVNPKHMLAEYGSLTHQTGRQVERLAGDQETRRPVLQKAEDRTQVLEDTAPKGPSQGQDVQEYAHHCQICKKGFTHKGSLYKHKQEHMNKRTPEKLLKM